MKLIRRKIPLSSRAQGTPTLFEQSLGVIMPLKYRAYTLSALLLAIASAANAATITETISFTASGFSSLNGFAPPTDPVKGSFTITYDPTLYIPATASGLTVNYLNIPTTAGPTEFINNPNGGHGIDPGLWFGTNGNVTTYSLNSFTLHISNVFPGNYFLYSHDGEFAAWGPSTTISVQTVMVTPVTFDTTSDSIISSGSGNTTVSGNTATTSGAGDTNGALMTGSGSGAYTWNINSNITGNGTGGFTDTTSAGTQNINVNNSTVQGDFAFHGINIQTSGSAVANIFNTGTIQGGSYASGINIGNSVVGTIDNYGSILGGTSGYGIFAVTGSTIGTINNYLTGTISGDLAAIDSSITGTGLILNTAGTMHGDVQMFSGVGTGDTINIYGGAIHGNIYGANGAGDFGSINFNLIDGTFGINGTSVNGTFATDGVIGAPGNNFKAININSGILTLNNDMDAGTTTIAGGAKLLINANHLNIYNQLVNNGTLNLQTNTLNVRDDISGRGVLKLQVQSGTGGSHGEILNGGAGTINLTNMTIDPYFTKGAVVNGEKLLVVSEPGTLSYTATNTMSSNGFEWTLGKTSSSGVDYQGHTYGVGDLLATASLITNNVAADNANSVNALSYYTGSNPNITALLNGLNSATDNKAGAQIQPNFNGGTVESALSAVGRVQDVISTRMQNSNGSGHSMGISSDEILLGTGFWTQGFGGKAEQGTISGVDGFSASTHGVTFGGDQEVYDDLRMGVAFSYANTMSYDSGNRNGSNEGMDSYIGNIYGTYKADTWYVDGMLTYGIHDVRTTRLVDYISPIMQAQGGFTAEQYGAKVEVGYPIAINEVTLTPLAAFAYDNLHQDGYTETGAGGADLIIGGTSADSYRTTLGGKASTLYTLDDDWKIRPTLFLGWKHEFNDKLVPDQDINFAGGGVSFITPGLRLSQNALDIAANLDLVSIQNVTLSTAYAGEMRNNYVSNTGFLKARFDF